MHNTGWPRNSIDRFILAKLEAQGRRPAPAADRRTLIRRATFDLIGLPPTPEEIDAFLADSAAGAFARVVDRLLNSPHYGERWGRHWLDVVRYADTAGDTADFPVPEAWRYRNYVIDAFNADKPYDEFLREQIAGDILARDGPRERYAERVTATGYLAISRRFGFDSENYHHLTIQDTIDTLGQSVLGLTLGCARCHNHKFDPVSSAEYYGLYGIFESTRYAFPGSEQKQKYRALVPLTPAEESQAKWREFEARFAAEGVNPGAVLRSLDGLDGDFEMQRAASGGSKGVLVQPWFYEGRISVTQEAQSPFKQLYPFGSVGVSVPAGVGGYRIHQSLYPARSRGLLHVNLDFRAATNNPAARGQHRFWIGARDPSPAVEVLISSVAVTLPAGARQEILHLPRPGQWHNLQLTLDLEARTVSGTVGVPGAVAAFVDKPFASAWTGVINFIAIDSHGPSQDALPALHLDNVGVQAVPIPPVSAAPTFPPQAQQHPSLSKLKAQLEALTRRDGDFEFGDVKPALDADNSVIREAPLPPPGAAPVELTGASREARLAKIGELRRQIDQLTVEAEKRRQELGALLGTGPLELAYGVAEGTPHNARLQLRGEPDQPGEEVPRGFLKILGGGVLPPDGSGSGRLELAQWLTTPENPLTARVLVNRLWQYHFGQGLVKTPNDFGTRGQPPTHPELLDHLATRFLRGGLSIKAMHRLILLSATYQQGSQLSVVSNQYSVIRNQHSVLNGPAAARRGAAALNTDALTTGDYSPFPRRRLDAEELRDSILFVSGELDPTPGRGQPFPAATSWGYTQHAPFSAVYDHRRRSVYLMIQRLKRHPFLALFDGADPNSSTPDRRVTTVPTQALYFLNDPIVHAQSEKFAARLQGAGADETRRIDLAYRLAFGRLPSETERAEAAAFLAAYRSELPAAQPDQADAAALAAFARVLFGCNEFLVID